MYNIISSLVFIINIPKVGWCKFMLHSIIMHKNTDLICQCPRSIDVLISQLSLYRLMFKPTSLYMIMIIEKHIQCGETRVLLEAPMMDCITMVNSHSVFHKIFIDQHHRDIKQWHHYAYLSCCVCLFVCVLPPQISPFRSSHCLLSHSQFLP